MRAEKTFKNVVWGFALEAVVIVCGLILPRLILINYGSDYNGVTNAIRQFLQVITLFQAGISGVTMAVLYKPLAEKDISQISIIVRTTESFLRKIVIIFLGFIVIISCGFPFLVIDQFDWFFSASMVLIMSLSACAQFYFGRVYELLLNADQNQRFVSIVNICKVTASTIISAIMINMGFGLRLVMLASAIVYIIAPLFVCAYTKRKYNIITNVTRDDSVLKQRWDNFGRQVAYFVVSNTDIVVLSFFSNVFEISVYTVYRMIVNGIYGLFIPLTQGVNAAFGNMLAKEEYELLKKNLRIYEQVVFASSTFLHAVVLVMTLPFVALYTSGVTDAEYHRPVFMIVFTIAALFRCFRFPYEGMAVTAGHFKQTRNPAFIEAAITIIISVSLVTHLGVIGIAIGMLTAYVFRTVFFAIYTSRNVVKRSLWLPAKRLLLSAGCIVLAFGISTILPLREATDFLLWTVNAVIISTIALILVLLTELVFYRDDLKGLLCMIKGVLGKSDQAAKTVIEERHKSSTNIEDSVDKETPIMTKAFSDMLYLFSCAVHGTPPNMKKDYDLDEICQSAARQGILPFILISINNLHRDGDVLILGKSLDARINDLRITIINYIQRSSIIQSSIDILKQNDIPVCVLKGDTFACLYKNPECRISNDTDIYISDEKKIKQAIRILSDMGFNFRGDPSNSHHLTARHKDAGQLEVHRSLFQRDLHRRWFEGELSQPEPYRMVATPYDNELPALGLTDSLIYSYLHIVKHFVNSGIGIRPVMDTLLYISKHKEEIDFKRFSSIIKELKYDKFYDHIQLIGVLYLGFAESDFYPFSSDAATAARILADMEDGGIFGNALPWRAEFSKVYNEQRIKRFSDEANDAYMMKWEKRSPLRRLFVHRYEMMRKYPYVAKSIFLLPIAWFHRLVLFIFESVGGKKSNTNENKNIEARLNLIRELDMI